MNYRELIVKALNAVGAPTFDYIVDEIESRCKGLNDMVAAMKGTDGGKLFRSTQSIAIVVQNYLLEHNNFD